MILKNQKYAFIGCDSSYSESKIVLFGAPFDGTSSFRAGSRFAPSAMRNESTGIETYSPYLDKDLSETAVFDAGDLELSFGNAQKSLKKIEKTTAQILKDNKIPVMIGGEHLITLGSVRAVLEQYPDLCIVHFDAHTDLRDDYLGEKLSHATVLRRIFEYVGGGRIFQFGIRSGEKEEFLWAKEHTSLQKFNFDGLAECMQSIKDKPVYLTVDLDVLDTCYFCGTGTPEAGGVTFLQLLSAISEVCKYNVVGCDINELSPPYDQSGASTAIACKILRELLLQL